MEDELHNSETAKKELEEKVSKLEIEKINLSKKAKENNDVLKRVAETEAQKRALDDKLTEKSKAFETLSQKYTSIKERVDNYDVIEEKVYLLEKERKEYRDTRKHLEEQIENLQTDREELREINDKSNTVNKTLQDEIAKLKEDRDKFETHCNSLRDEKESLVQELTRKNSDLKRKLETVRLEMDILKENTGKTNEENDKAEMEIELKKIKMQKEEMKKTCEDLASKLSKAYAELEQSKSPANNDETTGTCFHAVFLLLFLLAVKSLENFLNRQRRLKMVIIHPAAILMMVLLNLYSKTYFFLCNFAHESRRRISLSGSWLSISRVLYTYHVFKTRACTNPKWAKVLNLEWLNLRASDLYLIAILLSSKKEEKGKRKKPHRNKLGTLTSFMG